MKARSPTAPRALRLIRKAAMACAACTAMTAAQAAVVVVDFSANAFSSVPFTSDGFYLNVLTGAVGTTAAAVPGWDLEPYFRGTTGATPMFRFYGLGPFGGGYGMAAADATSTLAARFSAGDTVGASLRYIFGATDANTTTPGTNVFGFKFVNETTGMANYGYVRVQQTADPAVTGSVRILGYAYDDSGAAITVLSAVPEPGAALLLLAGLGVVGAAARKRSMCLSQAS